jgi:hypothetical protein
MYLQIKWRFATALNVPNCATVQVSTAEWSYVTLRHGLIGAPNFEGM